MKQNILLGILLAIALYLAAVQVRDEHIACWIEPGAGMAACSWDDVEIIRWPTSAAELVKYGIE